MAVRLIIGLGATAVAFAIAGRRVWWLYRLITSGQPTPGRLAGAGQRLGPRPRGHRPAATAELVGAGARPRLHVLGLLILNLTILEAYGACSTGTSTSR